MSRPDENEDKKYKSKDGRYMKKEESTLMDGVVQAGKYAAVGVGAYMIGHRTGAFHKVGKLIDVEGRAALRSLRKTASERDLHSSRLSKKTMTRFQENFKMERKKLKKSRETTRKKREYDVQKEIQRMHDYIGDLKSGKTSSLMDAIDDSVRTKRIKRSIEESGDRELLAKFKDIQKAINTMNVGRLRTSTKDEVSKTMKAHGIKDEDLIRRFNDHKEKVSSRNLVFVDDEAQEAYKKIRSAVEKKTIDSIVDLDKADSKFSRFTKGKRRATVDDMLKLHKEGISKLDEVTKAQLEKAKEINKDFGKVTYDKNLYYKRKNGIQELEDLSVYKEMKQGVLEYASKSMMGGIFHLRNYLNVKEGKDRITLRTLKRGSIQSSINPYLGKESTEQLDKHYVYIKGKVYDVFDNDFLNNAKELKPINTNRDIFLTSSRHGSLPRMYRGMAGTLTGEEDHRGFVSRTLDFRSQDTDSLYGQAKGFFQKFHDDDWGRHKGLDPLRYGARNLDEFKDLQKILRDSSYEGLDHRTIKTIQSDLPEDIQKIISREDFSLQNKDDLLDLFAHIGQRESDKSVSLANRSLLNTYESYRKSPEDFLAKTRTIGELNPFFKTPMKEISGEDIIRQEVSSYFIDMAAKNKTNLSMRGTDFEEVIGGYQSIRKQFDDALMYKEITKKEYESAINTLDYTQMSFLESNLLYSGKENAHLYLNKMVDLDDQFVKSAEKTVKKTHSVLNSYNPTPYENLVGDEYIAIGSSHLGDHMSTLFSTSTGVGDKFGAVTDIFKQVTASRDRMHETTLLTIAPFYSGYRLQEMLSHIGLGMSDASMRSTAHMYGNLFMKRVLPAYLLYEGAKYSDYKMKELTGRGFTEMYEDMRAEHRLLRSHEMTDQDRYDLIKQQQLRPGTEHFEAMPSTFLPGIGDFSPLGALSNIVVSGLSGSSIESYDSKESYTVTETYEDLFYGTEEIRKSKWWLAGSKSPYRGDRVVEYAPNSWRLAHSDWEYSGVGLTGEEYWGHHILPTFENPLGGLSFALGLRDPYYFEKKHYEDRPYMLTGELFNEGTPILGDFGNATIGRLIKPVKEMHKEYWDPNYEHEPTYSILSQLTDSATIEQVASRTNEISFYQNIPVDSFVEKTFESQQPTLPIFEREDSIPQLIADEGASNILLTPDGEVYTSDQLSLGITERRHLFGENSVLDLSQIPDDTPDGYQYDSTSLENHLVKTPDNYQYLVSENRDEKLDFVYSFENRIRMGDEEPNVGHLNYEGYHRLLDQTEGFVQMDYSHRENFFYDSYYNEFLQDNVNDPRSKEWRSQEFIENITEPLGVYKWMFMDEVMDVEFYQNQMVIQKADSAYNASSEFWQSNIGSLGGAYAEMARRFIRRESGQLEHYNPIRNTMPDWLPGEDYFINFLEGDPYAKIDHGERRLPGAGYESLHELHPDQFGEYGAFDRFKILADVAPWSDEYTFWSDYVQENIQDEELRKEATTIRKQASKIMQKYDFQDYRFKGNDVEYKSVTVEKILDDFTFIAKETGDTPIRLAGVQYTQGNEGLLSRFVSEGDKVEIGYDKDPTQRYSNDTYQTMKVVLRSNMANINQQIIEAGLATEDMNDFTAAGIRARFSKDEIEQGSRWERIAHAPTMINTKLLNVRTATEEYERDQIYGRDWATWEDFMFRDYLIPAVEGLGRHENPLWSVGSGALTGYVTSIFLLPAGKSRALAAGAGAGIGAVQYLNDKITVALTGKDNVPRRRLEEAEINEYYDFLEYLKYSALYEESKKEYEKKYKVNLNKYFREIDEKSKEVKEKKEGAEKLKRWYYINQPEGYEEKISLYNQVLDQLNFEVDGSPQNEDMALVMHYRDKMRQTIFGLDLSTMSRTEIMKAFPHKDRYFFNEFVDANVEDRRRILQLVPENLGRVYEAMWTGKDIERPTLDQMVAKYDIPDYKWDGWKPQFNLEDIKIKTIAENDNLDLTDFGFWDTDVYRGDFVPELNQEGGNEIKRYNGKGDIQREVRRVLRGQGLKDVDVLVEGSVNTRGEFNIDYTLDRSNEIEGTLQREISDFI